MKKKNILTMAVLVFLIWQSALLAQNIKTVFGTVGKENIIGKQLVICELGSQACMFLDVDPNLHISIDGKTYKPQDLQVGWYVKAQVEKRKNGDKVITGLEIDPNKTVICFSELSKAQGVAVEKLLARTKGIKKVTLYLKSKQVYLEYDPSIISYPQIEKVITGNGYKIE